MHGKVIMKDLGGTSLFVYSSKRSPACPQVVCRRWEIREKECSNARWRREKSKQRQVRESIMRSRS